MLFNGIIFFVLIVLFYLSIKMVKGSDDTAKQCIESVKRFQNLRNLESGDMIIEKRNWEDFTHAIELNTDNARSKNTSRTLF